MTRRPSVRSTLRLSSSTVRSVALGSGLGIEVVIPRSQEKGLVLLNHSIDPAEFVALESHRGAEFQRTEPKPGKTARILHMNVRWFRVLVALEEEAKWANTKNSRHGFLI